MLEENKLVQTSNYLNKLNLLNLMVKQKDAGLPIHKGYFKSVSMLEAACVIKIRSYLSLLHSSVDVFVLLELLQLCLNQHLSDVHHLLHGQRQTLHGETELLLQ